MKKSLTTSICVIRLVIVSVKERPREDSNHYLSFRRGLLYPVELRGHKTIHYYIIWTVRNKGQSGNKWAYNFCARCSSFPIRIVYYSREEGETITEEAWIARMAAGDRDAFRELVDKYGRYLFQSVFAVLRSTKDAEDVTQEVLLKICSSLPQYQYQGFKTWITRIAVNKAIDFRRARDRKKEQLTDQWESLQHQDNVQDNSLEANVISRERREQVRDQLERLPENYRDVVIAFYFEEKSYQQIADEQKMALKTVESKLYRAKQYMRKHWKEEEWK